MSLSPLQHNWLASLYRDSPPPLGGLRGEHRAERFGVYRASLIANLTNALRATFPVVDRLVGTEFLDAMAAAYIGGHPSASGDLHEYGATFPDFVAGFEPARELVYLPDVARLEWLAHEAFHAAEAGPLELERLAAVPPGRHGGLHFCPHPSVRLLRSDYPVHRIWQVNQEAYAGDATVRLDEGGVHLAVLRQGLEIVLLPLTPGAWAMAGGFLAGSDFTTAWERATTAEPELDAGPALYALIAQGVVAAFRD
jgi:Putative DNA-binding domain